MEFIITCGTSQTENLEDEAHTKKLGLALASNGYNHVKGFFVDPPPPNNDSEFLKRAGAPAAKIAEAIHKFLHDKQGNDKDPKDFIGKDTNPLGAELSTLYIYFNEKGRPKSGHIFHILRSDTYKGWFNALLLQKVIEGQEWGTIQDLYPVKDLCEKPPEDSDPQLNLSRCLKKILAVKHDPPMILIMSGGFKSVIPCLTVFSILFALPMVYLFEKSGKKQELTAIQEIRDRKKYLELWKEMSKLNLARNMPWFQEALDFRTGPEYLSWIP